MAKMSGAAKERLNEFNAKQSDWYAVCPRCNTALHGTIAEIVNHVCLTEKAE